MYFSFQKENAHFLITFYFEKGGVFFYVIKYIYRIF